MNQPVTFFPPIWVHNRAVVRRKTGDGPDVVIRRMRYMDSAETSTISLVPYDACMSDDADYKVWRERIDATTTSLSLKRFLDEYEKTGRIVSIMRVPL